MDLGFRSATFKYTAHYRALDQPENINEVISTGVVYSSGVAVLMMIATLLLAPYALHFFPVAAGYRQTFVTLVMLVGKPFSDSIFPAAFGLPPSRFAQPVWSPSLRPDMD